MDFMTERVPKIVPNSPARRRRLAKMVLRLFDCWELSLVERLALLKLENDEELNAFRGGVDLPFYPNITDRCALFLGIHRALRTLFPENQGIVYSWIRLKNRDLDNKTPIEIMKEEGLPGIARVAWHIGAKTNPGDPSFVPKVLFEN